MARQSGTSTAADQAAVRSWFNEHGRTLEPATLRAALEERAADQDLIVELLDAGADWRRAHPQPAPAPPARPPTQQQNGAARSDAPSVLPQNLEAEESVLGAMMMAPGACIVVRDILEPADFYRDSHAKIYRAALRLLDTAVGVDAITLTDELEQTGDLDDIGGRVRLHELAALVPATANVAHYARIVADLAAIRGLIRAGGEIQRLGWERPGDAGQLLEQARTIAEKATTHRATLGPPVELIHGGDFIFNEPLSLDEIRIWGHGEAIGWAGGEGLMVVGPDGVGKTTLCQQVALARAGLRTHALGLPVAADPHRVLYIAADRPRQAARSLRRMVTESERDQLNDRLHVWRGPLPAALNEDRTILTRLATQFGCGSIIIDSLKDVAFDLASDDAAGRIASSFQHAIAAGVELLVLHHPRKPGVESNRKPRALADVYGNRLIFGVFGSVIMLWGEPGDAYIDLEHLKQPMDPVGPWKLRHDHARGFTEIEHGTDLLDVVLRTGTQGVTVKQAAGLVYETPDPTKNHVERIRQRLDKLTVSGQLVKHPAIGRDEPARYLYNGPAASALLAPAPEEELF